MPQEVAPGSAKPGGWSRSTRFSVDTATTGRRPGHVAPSAAFHFLRAPPQAVVVGQRPNECAILHTVPDAGRLEVSLQ